MMRLRSARMADVPRLERWDRQPPVIRATTDAPNADKAFEGAHRTGELNAQDAFNSFFLMEIRGEPSGAMQMNTTAVDMRFSAPKATAVVVAPLASNMDAHRFCRRLGFKPVGRRRFGPNDCLIHRLERRDWRQGDPA